jgi:hypothetical protein
MGQRMEVVSLRDAVFGGTTACGSLRTSVAESERVDNVRCAAFEGNTAPLWLTKANGTLVLRNI